MKKILLEIAALFLITSIGYCQEINLDIETKAICNQTIENIFNGILKIKDKYHELKEFDRNVISKDGLRIDYGITKDEDYDFSFHINLEKFSQTGEFPPSYFSYGPFFSQSFPNLGLGFRVYCYKMLYSRYHSPGQKSRIIDIETKLREIIEQNSSSLKNLNDRHSPLQLVIKSDRQVYSIGEAIVIESEFKNISKKPIKISDYYKVGGISFYFKNEKGQTYNINYIDVMRRIMPIELAAGEAVKQGSVILNLRETENYKSAGKHLICMVDGTLTSNTITIEVKEKKDISKEEAIKLGNDYMKRHYGTNFSLKYITKPSEIFEAKDGWIITYAEKEPRTMPSGVVLEIDKKTGEVRLLPQE